MLRHCLFASFCAIAPHFVYFDFTTIYFSSRAKLVESCRSRLFHLRFAANYNNLFVITIFLYVAPQNSSEVKNNNHTTSTSVLFVIFVLAKMKIYKCLILCQVIRSPVTVVFNQVREQ